MCQWRGELEICEKLAVKSHNFVVAKTSSNNDVVLNISDLSRGFYVIKIVDEMGTVRVAKVCKE